MRNVLAVATLLVVAGCGTSTTQPRDLGAGGSDLATAPGDLRAPPDQVTPADQAVVADLRAAIPTLADLTPHDTTIAVGKSFPVTALFGATYFGSTPLDVAFSSSDGAVAMIPASGQLVFNGSQVAMMAAAVTVGQATISATFMGVTKMATVTVVPAVKSLTPTPLRLETGKTGTLTITLTDVAQTGGHDVVLGSSASQTVSVPATAHVAQGDTTVDVIVTAVAQGGPVAITATLAGSTGSASVLSITPVLRLAISEVLYDASNTDDGYEWVELWNGSGSDVDLAGYFLGNTASSTATTYQPMTGQLSGTIKAGECKLVGGPLADPTINALATGTVFTPSVQFNPVIPNGTVTTAVAVGLFQGTAVPNKAVDTNATPLRDAVIYGTAQRGLLDESGGTTRLDVGYVPFPRQTLERLGPSGWRIQPVATGGSCDWLHL